MAADSRFENALICHSISFNFLRYFLLSWRWRQQQQRGASSIRSLLRPIVPFAGDRNKDTTAGSMIITIPWLPLSCSRNLPFVVSSSTLITYPKRSGGGGNVSIVLHRRRWGWDSGSTSFTITRKDSSSCCCSSSSSSSAAAGLRDLEMTPENVNSVLDEVRPYLISDGGNVDVVSVENGVISLSLQGACGTCPSSTTTMKMGIERVLKEKFGERVKDVIQVGDDNTSVETTVDVVNAHLDILRPAIENYGGSVEVVLVEDGECSVRYVGPDSIGSGIKATIKEKFPQILNVTFI